MVLSVPRHGVYRHRAVDLRGHRGAQHVGEAVDVLAGTSLGDRHEQATAVLGTTGQRLQVGSGVDALGGATTAHGGHVGVQADRELADHGLLVELLNAGQRGERLAGVVGACQQQLAELDDPLPSKPGEVDDPAQRVERLGGADVRGRLLTTDVLLAGLEREHEATATVDIDGLPGDPPGHAPQVLLASREEPERGTSEVEAIAERLALADGHVDPTLAGRAQDAERERIYLGDHDRRLPGAVARRGSARGGGAERLGVLNSAVEVRLGEDGGAGVGVDRLDPGLDVGDAIAQRHLDDLHAIAVGIGREVSGSCGGERRR